MSYFMYKDKQIFWQESGSGHHLILLHGNTASSKMFIEIVPVFSSKYHVIYY